MNNKQGQGTDDVQQKKLVSKQPAPEGSEHAPHARPTLSRRKLLSALGLTGAALVSGGVASSMGLLSSSAGSFGEETACGQHVVYAETVTEMEALTGLHAGQLVIVQGTVFEWTGTAFERRTMISVYSFGAKGDYTTDDTAAIDALGVFCSATNTTAYFPPGVYRYVGSLDWPDGVAISGSSMPTIANYPQRTGGKQFLRPGYKHLIPGSSIVFSGTATKTVSTVRSDRFSSFSYAMRFIGVEPPVVRNIGFIQDVDVFNAAGQLTTRLNDNRAAFDVGIYHTGQNARFDHVNIFGYWGDAALVQHHEESQAIADLDYNTYSQCMISGGTAIIGHDTANPPAGTHQSGQTGTRFIGCWIGGADHHTRRDGDYTIPALYQDCHIADTQGGTRGLTIVGGNIRGHANEILKLDHARGISLIGVVWEAPGLSQTTDSAGNPVIGADESGRISVTGNTGDLLIWGGDNVGRLGLDQLASTIGGRFLNYMAAGLGNFVTGNGGGFVSLFGNPINGDPTIQLTQNLNSIGSDWAMTMNVSANNNLVFRYGGASRLQLNVDGHVTSPGGATFSGLLQGALVNRAQAATAIVSGDLAVQSGRGWIIADTEGQSASDQLSSISYPTPSSGQQLYIRTNANNRTITFMHGSSNMLCEGQTNFTLEAVRDQAVCVYDGTHWRCRKESY